MGPCRSVFGGRYGRSALSSKIWKNYAQACLCTWQQMTRVIFASASRQTPPAAFFSRSEPSGIWSFAGSGWLRYSASFFLSVGFSPVLSGNTQVFGPPITAPGT